MRRVYRICLLACFVAGGGLYASSFRYPWYNVPESELREIADRLWDGPEKGRWREWDEQTRPLETPRKRLHDIGVGLVSLAGMLGILYHSSRFPLKNARTPKDKNTFIRAYQVAVGAQIPASIAYLVHRQGRYEYPWWGDSIGIGMVGTIFGCLVFAAIGTLFFRAVLWKASLPAPLYVWPRTHRAAGVTITVLFGIPALLSLILVPGPVLAGSIGGVIMTLTMFYLFLSARAGVSQYRITKRKAAAGGPQGNGPERAPESAAAASNPSSDQG